MDAPRQSPPAESVWADELAFLAELDDGPRPPGWRLTPRMVVTFIVGSEAELVGPQGRRRIAAKFVGDKALVERSVLTLAGTRGLLLVGEPGTAKSMLSELLAAAISGTSEQTVQGSAGTTEDQLRYGWNYALLVARGPSAEALVPSPVYTAMSAGSIVRVEEVTRCLPEVQDALVSILSDRRIAVPELGTVAHARPGFNLIATANLRDRGVSEMSSALKRRFNFETVAPIADAAVELTLVQSQAAAILARTGLPPGVDEAVLKALVTVFRDLRSGRTEEGWSVEKPSTVMSTAEAVSVATTLGLSAAYLARERDPLSELPGHLLGVVSKDDPEDRGRLLAYWDGAVKRRAEGEARLWKRLYELRTALDDA